MLGCSSLFGLTSDPLKDTFLLYKRVTEQYRNPEILRIIRSLIPDNIVSQTIDDENIVPLLKCYYLHLIMQFKLAIVLSFLLN